MRLRRLCCGDSAVATWQRGTRRYDVLGAGAASSDDATPSRGVRVGSERFALVEDVVFPVIVVLADVLEVAEDAAVELDRASMPSSRR